MNRTQPTYRTLAEPRHARRFTTQDAIEWEELPSLAGALRRNDFATTCGHVWLSTEPIDLQPPMTGRPAPFAEPIDGMQVREIEGESLFGHLFRDGRDH
ncbi:MAG TPA: hypothetical protein VLE45_12260 [Burkholderiaceae bacterium]|nr:hypothetical protein [Burkholderiaceae bacterium]